VNPHRRGPPRVHPVVRALVDHPTGLPATSTNPTASRMAPRRPWMPMTIAPVPPNVVAGLPVGESDRMAAVQAVI
jgi:hypothetical protein